MEIGLNGICLFFDELDLFVNGKFNLLEDG